MLTGTCAELSAIRAAWRAAAEAAAAAEASAGGPGGDPGWASVLRRCADRMGAERFAVVLPCLLRCGRRVPVDVQVGGKDGEQNAVPGAVLCGPCNAEATAEVIRQGTT
jgi:hypothetical protein